MLFPIGDDQVKGGKPPILSYLFIGINVLIFIFQFTMAPEAIEGFVTEYGAIPAEIGEGRELFDLVTCMFLHGGFMHLLGNMVFLWVFGDNIEATVGSPMFLLLYIVGGFIASFAHMYFNWGSMIPTIGASGAVAALLGAYLVMFPKSRIKTFIIIFSIRIPAIIFLGIWMYGQFSGLFSSSGEGAGVAWWAHIGGFAFGVLAGLLFRAMYTMPELDRPDLIAGGR